MNEMFSKRFRELKHESDSIPFEYDEYGSGYAKSGIWRKWATSAESLIKAVYGQDSPHYQNFIVVFKNCNGSDYDIESLQGIFMSAKEAYEGGYLFNVELSISGEIFGDFVNLAKQALNESHKDVAAVLASAALEDALKRYAKSNGINVDDATMQKVIGAIKSAGLVTGARKTLLESMPRIRNYAMHAQWDKITEPEVNSMIGFVEQFLLTEFS